MNKKILASAIVLGLSLSSSNALANEQEDAASIGELIIDKAKDKFVSAVGSLLVDAIFGSSGPQFVNLSEQSLQEIQNRVREELIKTAEYEFIAEFNSLEGSLNHYSDTVNYNNPDAALLSSLVVKVNDVMNHHALNPNFNSDYYYMADSYALAASVSMSVFTERYLNGWMSAANVSSQAYGYSVKLETMVNAKKAQVWPLREDCYDPDPYDQDVESKCSLRDPFGNRIAGDAFDPRDAYDRQRWADEVAQATAEYYEKHIGNLEDVVNDLRNF